MTGLRGYFHPKTATGASSLIPSPPWRYSGDLLTVEYRTDPARVRELLPEPLELAEEDPGAVALIWADWQSCSASGEELLDPVRAQYKEAFAVVRCRYRGQTYSRCVYIWVDKDFAIARDCTRVSEEAGLHPSDATASVRARSADRGGGAVRGDAGGCGSAYRAGRGDAAGAVRERWLRQCASHGPPSLAAVDREGQGAGSR